MHTLVDACDTEVDLELLAVTSNGADKTANAVNGRCEPLLVSDVVEEDGAKIVVRGTTPEAKTATQRSNTNSKCSSFQQSLINSFSVVATIKPASSIISFFRSEKPSDPQADVSACS